MIASILFYIYLTATTILFLFFLRYIIVLLGFKKKEDKPINPVSIVVCAHYEYSNLQELLPILLSQNHPDYEVIIVDDRSQDETYDFLIEEREKNKNLKVVKVDEVPSHANGKKYGLTLGIKAAKNDIILLTDADCRPTNNWAAEMSKVYTDKTSFVLGYSNYQNRKGLLNLIIRYETVITGIQYIGEAIAGNPYMGVGRNLSYRKSFFLQNKGFNRFFKITGGDDDLLVNSLAKKKNTRVVVGAESMVTSTPKKTWREYFRQKRRHLSVGKYYKGKDKLRIGIWGLSFILHWLTFIPLILLKYELYFVAGGYLLKMIAFYLMFAVGLKKLADKMSLWLLPILDFINMIYFIWGGILMFSRKKVKWS